MVKSNKTLHASKTDLLDTTTDETIFMKNSRIRIQLPKLETLDASGLIPPTNNHENHSNGFYSDAELSGKQ